MRIAMCMFTYKDDFESFQYDFDIAMKSINEVDTIFIEHPPFHRSPRYEVFFDNLLLNNIKLIEKDVGVGELTEYLGNKGYGVVVIKSEVNFYVKRSS